MKDSRDIIIRPVLTEKSWALADGGHYTFQVHPQANKIEIRRAVEDLFPNVTVRKVNTLWVRGKRRRLGRLPEGRTPRWKKAIVTLAPGQSIREFRAT